MLRVSVTVNPNKDKNLFYTKQLLALLAAYDVKVCMSDIFKKPYGSEPPVADSLLAGCPIEYYPEYLLFKKADLCIVFGGDGTILKIAKKAASGGAYILGINLGRVGYIAELETGEMDLLKRILCVKDKSEIEKLPDIKIDERMMLKTELVRGANVIYSGTALNDVVISKGAVSRMAELDLLCDGKTISSYRADGIVVATPTGSTAYCMSAGGPIIDPGLGCICAVPVCPYMCIHAGAVVFSDRSTIEVRFTADKINEAFCAIDGKTVKSLYNGDVVRITKADFTTKLIRLKDVDFYSLLNRKLAMAQSLPDKRAFDA